MPKDRDYKREYERSKHFYKKLSINIPPELYEDFNTKVELDGTTKNNLLKKWIEEYTYGERK